MDINFTITKYGVYGGGLNKPFQYFGKIISDHLRADGIESSLTEVLIIFAYPLTSRKNQSSDYKTWFGELPYIRFAKNRTAVTVTLPFCDATQKPLRTELDAVFRKTAEAFELIESKRKRSDLFETALILSSLAGLQKQLNPEDVEAANGVYELQYRASRIEKNRCDRLGRENENAGLSRLIYDIRFYYHFENIGNRCFYPYANEFCDEILQKLRDRKFKLPRYSHIYVMVSDTLENAMYHATRLENWYVYGLAVLENPENYAARGETDKKRIVFDLLKNGLIDVAKTDTLDIVTLNEVLDEVEKKHFCANITE